MKAVESHAVQHESGPPAPSGRPEGGDPRWLVFCICAVLAAGIWAVFGQTTRFGFINFDDPGTVYENPVVMRGLELKGLGWAFTHSEIGHWDPLTIISHMADCQFFGLRAGGHHFVNVLLHTAVALLLFFVLRRMTDALWPSAVAAAFFAIHPLRVESVAWITERKDVLSGLFFMFTLLAYERYVRLPWSLARYLVVVLLFALGLLSKSMLVTVPFVLLLLDWWPLQRTPGIRFSRLVLEKLPLLALSIIIAVTQVLVARKQIAMVANMPLAHRVANALVSYAAYLGKAVHPVNLAVYYPHPGGNLGIGPIVLALLLLAGVSALVFAWRKAMPWLAVGWLWYLGMLVPVIGVLQAGELAMADRYTYLPQIGLSIALAWTLDRIHRSWPGGRRVVETMMLLALSGLTFLAWRQTSLWRDSETLWTHALACTSQNWLAHYNLGVSLSDRGRGDEAIVRFRMALEIKPNYDLAHNNLGVVLVERGQVDEAVTHYRKALAIQPDHEKAHNNLGLVLAGRGRVDEAIAHYRKALAIQPDYAMAHNNLGLALAGRGQVNEAIAHYRKALEIQPNHEKAHNNLATALAGRGQVDEAITHYQKALEIKPDWAEAHYNFGLVLAGCGQLDEAIAHYRKALEIKPGDPEVHNNLGLALAGRGQLDEAIVQFRKALEIKPDYPKAHNNLGLALAGRGRVDEAIAHYRQALQCQPDNIAAYVLLGDALAGRGKLDEALANYQKALDLASAKNDTTMVGNIRKRIQRHQSDSPTSSHKNWHSANFGIPPFSRHGRNISKSGGSHRGLHCVELLTKTTAKRRIRES
jgi:tetratricopeptide (TPR) repeat protein